MQISNKIKNSAVSVLLAFLFFNIHNTGHAQILGFYPQLDTVVMTNYMCGFPIISAQLVDGTDNTDSIFIVIDSNSTIGYWVDNWNYIEYEPYFLVLDTLDQFEYDMEYISNYSYSFPLDSTIDCFQTWFSMKLRVRIQDSCIDSLTQFFKAEGGLETSDEPILPKNIRLFQNYPNPFNPITRIEYDVINSSVVEISLYSINGRLVKTLFSGYQNSGKKIIELDGSALPSGIYFYKLKSDGYSETKKCVLLK